MSLGDRFIPSRVNAEVANQSLLAEDDVQRADTSLSHERYKLQLQRELLGAEHRPPPRLPAMMLNATTANHSTTGSSRNRHDQKHFALSSNVNANSVLDESTAHAAAVATQPVAVDADAHDRVTVAVASVSAPGGGSSGAAVAGATALSGDVMPGGGDLPRAANSRRARSLSTSSLLAHTADARRLGAASAASTRTSPPTVSVRRRNRLAESGAALFRDDAMSSSGVDLFELESLRSDPGAVYSFGNIAPRILQFGARSTRVQPATEVRVARSAPTTPRDTTTANENSEASRDDGADTGSTMRAQLRAGTSIFCVPTVITRRQRGPESEPQRANTRAINKVPYRVHDAPGVGGDFYLQQMAAASGRDQLAIVLGEAVYGMRWCDQGHTVLATGERGSIGSVAFAQGASRLLGVGTANSIELYDASIERGNAIVVYHTNILAGRRSHSSMAWRDDNVFAVGQGDADVSVWDVRMPSDQAQAHTLSSHRGVVCGLAFGPDGRLASGGNDGQLNVWDLRRPSEPTVAFEQHRAAAVKAIAWHPDVRNVLASGGGSADRYLRLWDVDARRCFNRRDTRSQVTGLLWSTQHNELISSHGYSEEAALALWTTPDLHRVAQLHSINRRERALYMVGSNCGRFIAIADTVRTLSFYSVFISDVDHALQDDENSDSNAALISATALASAPPVVRAAASTTSREHKRSGGAQRVSKRGRMSSWTIR
jgi:hypothetical protein